MNNYRGIGLRFSKLIDHWTAFIGFFLLLSFVKAPFVLLSPRLWAEEGSLYLQHALESSPLQHLLYTANSNFQLPVNLITLVATYFSIEWWPTVTTYLSMGIWLFAALFLRELLSRNRVSLHIQYIAFLVIFTVPSSYEIWLTSTNLQWVFGFVAFLIFLDFEPRSSASFWFRLSFISLAATSGIPATILSPAYIFKGLMNNSPFFISSGIFLGCGALIQISVIFMAGGTGRDIAILSPELLQATFLQCILAPVAGVPLVDHIGHFIRDKSSFQSTVILFYVFALLIISLFWSTTRGFAGSYKAWACLLVGIFVVLVQASAPIGGQQGLVSAAGGARYFYVGTSAIIIALALASSPCKRNGKGFRAIWGALLIVQAVNLFGTEWNAFFREGPRWEKQVKKCRQIQPSSSSQTCTLDIWPNGWKIKVPHREIMD